MNKDRKTKGRGNGEGSIYFIESKKLWAAQVTVGRDDYGKLKRKTVYAKTRKEVKSKLNDIMVKLSLNTFVDTSGLTVGAMIHDLVEEDFSLNIIKENSYIRKAAISKRINQAPIGSLPIQKVTAEDIKRYLKGIVSYSDSVIVKDYAMLNRCFRTAIQRDIIIKNPMDGIRKPRSEKPTKKVRALTIEEEKELIRILNNEEKKHKYRCQLLLMLYTGMRMGEINALKEKDINFDFRTINVQRTLTRGVDERPKLGETTKTYAGQRLLQMTDTVYSLLKEYYENSYIENKENLIFYDTGKQKFITTNQCNMFFSRIKEKYKFIDETLPGAVDLHSLRHTFATRCIESGMPVKVLQHNLGHRDIKTTLDTYCDIFEKFDQEHLRNAEKYMNKILA